MSHNGYKELVLFRTTADREQAAWTFLKWIYEDDNLAKWCVESGTLPVTRTAFETDIYQNYVAQHPIFVEWINAIPHSRKPFNTFAERLYPILWDEAWVPVINGQQSARTALVSTAQKAQKVLDEIWAELDRD